MSFTQKMISEISISFFRTHFYRHGFFDGTHHQSLAIKYLLRDRKHQWKESYEKSIAKKLGVSQAVTFGAGRMALYAILEALEIGPGDEVILPAFTCVVVPNAILYRGAIPIYVDIQLSDFNIDVSQLESKITKKTKAVIAQHTFGQPCQIEDILHIARRHALTVIEDCAHALGGMYKGQPLGTFGDAAFSSTDRTKITSTITGGFAVSMSKVLTDKIRLIQKRSSTPTWLTRARIFFQYGLLSFLSHPQFYWLFRLPISLFSKMKLTHFFSDELILKKPSNYPLSLSNFQSYIGLFEMGQLENNIHHRRRMAQRYQEILLGSSDISMGAFLRFSLLVQHPEAWQKAVGKYFEVGRWFSSVTHGRIENLERVGYTIQSCPKAEFVVDHIINFPTHFLMDQTALGQFNDLLELKRLKQDVIQTNMGTNSND